MQTIRCLISILLFMGLYGPVHAEDVCERLIPASLRAAALKKYPDYRIAKSTDRLNDDPRWNKDYKEGQCLTVASADFDGDKIADYAFFLVKKDSNKPKLIAALSRGKRWDIAVLPIWNQQIEVCYVETIKPGTYEHTQAYEFEQSNTNERERLTTKNTSIIAGKVESTGVVYVYKKSRWFYVWVTD
jgi:hypothetical protein